MSPKVPTFIGVFVVNHLVLGGKKSVVFMVLRAHGEYTVIEKYMAQSM